jgi:transcriptional regulator with XRE-family HTH domain
MDLDTSSFGHAISSARKKLEMSQKELAGKIRKEDGEAITPQYLNDIERPPSRSTLSLRHFARRSRRNNDAVRARSNRPLS